MRSVIFTQRVDIIESYGERRDCADQRISSFISACGYVPFPVPNSLKREQLEEFVRTVRPAGIVLTGGNSLVKYGGNAPERDSTEHVLMDIAGRDGLAVYGFCRGMQFVLDYFGQKLEDVRGHVAVHHELISTDRRFSGRIVNSYHNQACREITSDCLAVLACTSDGVIEAVRHKSRPVICTMWHPEREEPFEDADMELFRQEMKC